MKWGNLSLLERTTSWSGRWSWWRRWRGNWARLRGHWHPGSGHPSSAILTAPEILRFAGKIKGPNILLVLHPATSHLCLLRMSRDKIDRVDSLSPDLGHRNTIYNAVVFMFPFIYSGVRIFIQIIVWSDDTIWPDLRARHHKNPSLLSHH